MCAFPYYSNGYTPDQQSLDTLDKYDQSHQSPCPHGLHLQYLQNAFFHQLYDNNHHR